VIERWEQLLGLPRGGWFMVSGFRLVVTLVAMLDAAPSGATAFLELAEQCGFDDDGSRAEHPAASLARTHRNWLRAAWRKKFPVTRRPVSRDS
jgi:hypothetical protein